MIEKAVWSAKGRNSFEREDLRAQAFLLFCEAFRSYDDTRASFSTHLHNALLQLRNYQSATRRKYCESIESARDPKIKHFSIMAEDFGFDTRSKDWQHQHAFNEDQETEIRDFNYELFCETIERVESYITLSDDAQDIIRFLLKREWEVPGTIPNLHPSFHSVKKLYRNEKNWMPSRTKEAWQEIKNWWLSYNHPISKEA